MLNLSAGGVRVGDDVDDTIAQGPGEDLVPRARAFKTQAMDVFDGSRVGVEWGRPWRLTEGMCCLCCLSMSLLLSLFLFAVARVALLFSLSMPVVAVLVPVSVPLLVLVILVSHPEGD